VVLPVAAADERKRPAPARNITGYEGARRRVLVADDKPYNRLVLRDILEPLGFEVSAAGDGQQALDRAREAHPDVILMDLVMPVKTGFVATQELRQRPEFTELVIIAISASVLEADREKSLMAGCDAFLPKPVHVDELLDALASHLTLNWIYAEPEAGAEGAAPLVLPSPEVLAALPLDVLSSLEQAAAQGNVRMVDQAIEAIRPHNTAVANALAVLAKEFKYQEIWKMIQKARHVSV
ncbi:MAG: response regulator, partial [Alphaproteobacteria bacterium]|nr:response regulator [Alphaproteobacteria bacterium]